MPNTGGERGSLGNDEIRSMSREKKRRRRRRICGMQSCGGVIWDRYLNGLY